MVVVERHGRIGAPVEAVWDVVRRAETLPRWLAGVTRCEQDGEGHGARRLMISQTGAAVRARIIAYREPSLIAWRECVDADAPGDPPPVPIARVSTELHVELRPDGDGTLIRLIRVHRPGGFWRGLALRLVGARRDAAALDRSLAVLATGRMRPTDEPAGQPRRHEDTPGRPRRHEDAPGQPRRHGDTPGRPGRSEGVPGWPVRDEDVPVQVEDLAARMRRLDRGFAARMMHRDGDSAAGGADRATGVPEPREPGPVVRGSGLVRRTVG